MRTQRRRIAFGLLLAGAMALCALPAGAQSRVRNERNLSSVGRGGVGVGQSAVTRLSSGYAGNAARLSRPSSGGSGPTVSYALRSGPGVSPFGSYSSPVVSARTPSATVRTSFSSEPTGSLAMRNRQLTSAGPRMAPPVGGASGINKIFAMNTPAGIFEGGREDTLLADAVDDDDSNAIATFAPPDDSAYALSMRAGERAFRNQEYVAAFARFETAYRLGRDPESLLSMAHAKFASGSYVAAASYLRMVLREVPQLPRINNYRPRNFYGDRTVYVSDMRRLDEYIARYPDSPDAALLKAYFSWFDPDRGPVVALRAVTDGLVHPNPPQATQALEMFQESMLSVLQEPADESEDVPAASREVSG